MPILNYLTESLDEARKHGVEEYASRYFKLKEYSEREDSDLIYTHASNDFFDSY